MNERQKRSEMSKCLYVFKASFIHSFVRYLSPYPCFVPGTVKLCCEDYGHSFLFNIDILLITFFFLTWRHIPLVFGTYRYVSCGMSIWWNIFPSLIRSNELRLFLETCTLVSKRLGKPKGPVTWASRKNSGRFCWNWSWISPTTGKAGVGCEDIVEIKMKAGPGQGKVKDFAIRLVLWS